jgi:thiamine biosynthesis protein ThiS
MVVTVNGDDTDVPEGASVLDLLHQLGLGEKWVVVERNGDPVERRHAGDTVLTPGDRLELVRAVAGG